MHYEPIIDETYAISAVLLPDGWHPVVDLVFSPIGYVVENAKGRETIEYDDGIVILDHEGYEIRTRLDHVIAVKTLSTDSRERVNSVREQARKAA
jgi:hypothetical protein